MSLDYPTIDLTDDPEDAKSVWEELCVRLEQLAGFALKAHLSKIKMLEIGCGRAKFLRYALGQGADIVGVDRNLFDITDLPIFKADIAIEIPFHDNAFDLLYANGIFASIYRTDQSCAFKEIQRVMKAGALFAIKDVDQPDFEIAEQHGLELTSQVFADYYSVLRKK